MPITIVATPGASDANSFCTLTEANTYHERRIALDPAWVTTGDPPAILLIMATRILNAMTVARKHLRWDKEGKPYFYTSRAWTGSIVDEVQALAWPRKGMFDRLGRAIAENAIPQELKDATSELAGQLGLGDRTLDNDVKVQGITSIKAGSVALSFKEVIEAQVLPDMVLNLMPPSWFTDEIVTYGVNEIVFVAV